MSTALWGPGDDRELELISGAADRARLPCTELGNAQRLVAVYGSDLRYVPGIGWLAWAGQRWERSEVEVEARAKRIARSVLVDEAAQIEDADHRRRHTQWAHRSESASGLKNMLKLAASEPEIVIDATRLDADPWTLNVLNGTLDLSRGTLHEPRREDLITRLAPVEYREGARCPHWERFLSQVTGDPEIEAFLRRAVGYTLTGLASEEKVFFAYGPAASGKSTFLEAIRAILGEYATVSDFEAFLRKRGDAGPRNDLARLAGARLVIASEVQEGRAFDEAVVKSITGGDMITARYLYRESFEFRPQFTLWLAGNSRPAISAHDSGMWRRILLVPFPLTIPERQRDPALKQRLTTDPDSQAAILAWAVRGCQEWQELRLAVPDAVRNPTAEYRAQSDPLRDWLVDRCRFDPAARTLSRALRDDHDRWCRRHGATAASNTEWGEGLRQRGVHRTKSGGHKAWRGIALVQEDR